MKNCTCGSFHQESPTSSPLINLNNCTLLLTAQLEQTHVSLCTHHMEMSNSSETTWGSCIDTMDMIKLKSGICLISTICSNYEGYSKQQIVEAEKARKAMAMVDYPTKCEFMIMVRSSIIPNCNVTPEAITNAFNIFQHVLAGIRGKMTRQKPDRIVTEGVAISCDLMIMHKYMMVMGDVMFVNGVLFLITAIHGLNILSAEFLDSRIVTQIAHCLQHILPVSLAWQDSSYTPF